MKLPQSAIVAGLFHLGWLGCVFFAQWELYWQTLFFPFVLMVTLHFMNRLNLKSLTAGLAIAVAGILFDSFSSGSQLISISGQTSWLVPIWLISLWVLFSQAMIALGATLHPPLWAAAGLGFVFGPLSYLFGQSFEILFFDSTWTFWIYAVFWALLFPFTLKLAKRVAI